MVDNNDNDIFKKFTVIDFTSGESGAVCTEYLAMAGMNVIRVEKPGSAEKRSRYRFITDNLNKTCITLDVEKDEGKEIFSMLLNKADVLVENLQHGGMEQLGFGYETVRAANPRLIYTSLKPFSKGAPWQDYPANRTVVNALGGATYLCGHIGGDPVEPGVDLPDVISGVFGALGICAALYQRELTGEGQSIEISQQASLVALSRSAYEFYSTNRRNNRPGNAFPTMPDMVPMDMYPAKGEDQWVILGCQGEGMFAKLCEAMGQPELQSDPRFIDPKKRSRYKMELNRIIENWTVKHDKYELMEMLLQERRIVCSAVRSIDDIVNDEEARTLGPLQKVVDEECGEMWIPAMPCNADGINTKVEPPITGDAANSLVFASLLGLSEEQINRLSGNKVI